MSQLIGKWKLVRSENFEEYLKKMGVNSPMRKLAVHMSPTCDITRNGDEFAIKMNVPVITIHEQKFILGTPFEDLLPNGEKKMTIATMENEDKLKLIQQDEPDEPHEVIREIVGEEMVMTCKKGSVSCTRIFKRLKDGSDA